MKMAEEARREKAIKINPQFLCCMLVVGFFMDRKRRRGEWMSKYFPLNFRRQRFPAIGGTRKARFTRAKR